MSRSASYSLAIDYFLQGIATDNLLDGYGVPINSTLVYNQADQNYFTGFVINITINFFRPFRPEATIDGLLWLFVVTYRGEIRTLYPVMPQINTDAPLLQSFSLVPGVLTVFLRDHLAVGTFAPRNTSGINQLCALDGGISVLAPLSNNINETMTLDQRWYQQIGAAFSYLVLRYGKWVEFFRSTLL